MKYDIEVLLPEEEAPTPARTWCYSETARKRGTLKGHKESLNVRERKCVK